MYACTLALRGSAEDHECTPSREVSPHPALSSFHTRFFISLLSLQGQQDDQSSTERDKSTAAAGDDSRTDTTGHSVSRDARSEVSDNRFPIFGKPVAFLKSSHSRNFRSDYDSNSNTGFRFLFSRVAPMEVTREREQLAWRGFGRGRGLLPLWPERIEPE